MRFAYTKHVQERAQERGISGVALHFITRHGHFHPCSKDGLLQMHVSDHQADLLVAMGTDKGFLKELRDVCVRIDPDRARAVTVVRIKH